MTRLCSWLARAVASVRGASVVTGVRDTIFQATGGLTSQALRAASISAMGPRGNPFHNPGGGLSIGLNLMVGVPFAVYAGYRTGLILANAAPQAWRGPFARTGIRIAGFALVTVVPLVAAVSLASTIDERQDDATGEQLFEFFAFIASTNARCAGQILRDAQNHLSRGLMPVAVITDRNGYGMADSPDYTRFHFIRLGLLTSVYFFMVMFYRQVAQTSLQEAYGLPVSRRGSFNDVFGSNMGLVTVAAIVEGIDGIMGPLMQRLALRVLGGTVTYTPATGQFLSLFDTREAAMESLDIVVVNGFMRASFFYLVDPFAAFGAREPIGSALRVGLQSIAVVPHTMSEWRGHTAQRCLAEEDRQQMEREERNFFDETGVQFNRGEPSVASVASQQRTRRVRQPNSENVFDRHPDATVTWHFSSRSQTAWPPSFQHTLNLPGARAGNRRDEPGSQADMSGRRSATMSRPSASVSVMPMHMHLSAVAEASVADSWGPAADPQRHTEEKIPPVTEQKFPQEGGRATPPAPKRQAPRRQ